MSPICVMCEVQGVKLSAEFAVRLLSAEISRQCVSTALQKKPFAIRCRSTNRQSLISAVFGSAGVSPSRLFRRLK
ncbi:hypothetical protein M2350_002912 [Candidatus Fervidibacter sacchari]|uniref:Uncharacterized protein n=1 Tax=Candidatus Fervidibacter sacchari TaxID=1448929 RepID=A0ABT2ER87_9BACT|nr:hypothetical protein [Candidatus Fervidibacter sacchari]